MERSENEIMNTNVGSSDQTGFGGSQSSYADNQSGAPGSSQDSGVSGRVKSVATTVRQKASTIPAMLADGLEAGAQALRQNKLATSTASDGSSTAVPSDSSIVAVTDTLADG